MIERIDSELPSVMLCYRRTVRGMMCNVHSCNALYALGIMKIPFYSYYSCSNAAYAVILVQDRDADPAPRGLSGFYDGLAHMPRHNILSSTKSLRPLG